MDFEWIEKRGRDLLSSEIAGPPHQKTRRAERRGCTCTVLSRTSSSKHCAGQFSTSVFFFQQGNDSVRQTTPRLFRRIAAIVQQPSAVQQQSAR